MALQDDRDVPVLNSVVRAGSEPIIQSNRFGYQVLDELEAMRQGCDQAPNARISFPGLGDGSTVHLMAETCEHDPNDDTVEILHPPVQKALSDGVEQQPDITLAATTPQDAAAARLDPGTEPGLEPELERMIDALIDRHVTALRHDLIVLLGGSARQR